LSYKIDFINGNDVTKLAKKNIRKNILRNDIDEKYFFIKIVRFVWFFIFLFIPLTCICDSLK